MKRHFDTEDELKLYLIAVKNLPYQLSVDKSRCKLVNIEKSSMWSYLNHMSRKVLDEKTQFFGVIHEVKKEKVLKGEDYIKV